MKLDIVNAKDKNVKITVSGIIDEIDKWTLPSGEVILRQNILNGETQELDWRDILAVNPQVQRGFNLYLNDLGLKKEIKRIFTTILSFYSILSIDGEIAFSSNLWTSDLTLRLSNIEDEQDFMECEVDIAIDSIFDDSFFIGIKNLSSSETMQFLDVIAELKTNAGSIYQKKLLFLREINSWIIEDRSSRKSSRISKTSC